MDVVRVPLVTELIVYVPRSDMAVCHKVEEAAYSARVVNAWVDHLCVENLAREANDIIKLAFTRPRLLMEVMNVRKTRAKQLARYKTLTLGRERMKLLRHERAIGRRPMAAKAKAKGLGRGGRRLPPVAAPPLAVEDGSMEEPPPLAIEGGSMEEQPPR